MPPARALFSASHFFDVPAPVPTTVLARPLCLCPRLCSCSHLRPPPRPPLRLHLPWCPLPAAYPSSAVEEMLLMTLFASGLACRQAWRRGWSAAPVGWRTAAWLAGWSVDWLAKPPACAPACTTARFPRSPHAFTLTVCQGLRVSERQSERSVPVSGDAGLRVSCRLPVGEAAAHLAGFRSSMITAWTRCTSGPSRLCD